MSKRKSEPQTGREQPKNKKDKHDAETNQTIHYLKLDAYIRIYSTLIDALKGDWVIYSPEVKGDVEILKKRECLKSATLYDTITQKETTIHQITGLGKKVQEKRW